MGIQTATQAVSNEVYGTANPFFFRNRVTNGDYRVDQRNEGVAITNQSSYMARPADMCRTGGGNLTTGRYSAQRMSSRNTSSTGYESGSAPNGFTNSIKYTITASESESTGAALFHSHFIEGYQISDFDFGTTVAKKFTVSFWIKSSVVGTYELVLNNGASPYTAYYTSYTINQANTWEYKTITVSGPTSSSPSWSKDASIGLRLDFALKRDSSSSDVSTPNVWLEGTAGDNKKISGAVNLFATNGATWYITGLQVELGNLATPFELRPYPLELSLCQRYFEVGYGFADAGTAYLRQYQKMVPKRVTPSVTLYSKTSDGTGSGESGKFYQGGTNKSSITATWISKTEFRTTSDRNYYSADTDMYWKWTAESEF